jgi:hypothetical protein
MSKGRIDSGKQAMPRSLIASVLLWALSVASHCEASIVREMPPQQLVHYAKLAFAGTVIDTKPERLGETIVTRVVFSDLRFAKGKAATPTLTLTLEGGRIGEEGISVSGQPGFLLGQRYIVLTTTDVGEVERELIPVVGLYQGVFRITKDGRGRSVVLDPFSRAVVRISADRLTVVLPDSLVSAKYRGRVDQPERDEDRHGSPHEIVYERNDPGTRLTEEEFLNALRRLVE